jgi:hypothetical protein
LSLKTKINDLSVVWLQNHYDGFFGLISKSVATVFFGLALKLVTMISPNLTSKTVVGFLVEPQNQGGGFLTLCLKIDSHDLMI